MMRRLTTGISIQNVTN